MNIALFKHVTVDGESKSVKTADEAEAQRAVYFFNANDKQDDTAKQAFQDAGLKRGFAGEAQLTNAENGWKMEKSITVTWQ